ncbi:MAG: nuclear transport factor 2 family protein [Bryobacteraceae bacterium]
MRLFAILLLTVSAGFAQSDQSKVEAVVKQLERAEQTGDFNTWASLWTREKSVDIQKMQPYARARPEVQYQVTKSFVQGDKAVLLVQAAPNSFATMTLRREGGEWKIQDQLWKDTAPDPKSIYALAPPDPGTFARAGSPWDQVAPAMDPSHAARQGWQMKAVFDESYLLYPD